MRTLTGLILLVLLAVPLLLSPDGMTALAQAPAAQGALERVVILSRHGVRSPTQNTETLNSWRQTTTPAWPDFGVPPGHLTPKGQALMQEMGASYRIYFDKNGLFASTQCPDKVLIWADQDQRTLVSAQGLGIGLTRENQDCPFEISKATEKIDPVFHPTEALPQCHLDPDKVREEVRDPDKLKDTYRSQLDKAQEILKCCSARLCENSCNGLGDPNCALETLPSCTDAAKGQASVKGGLEVAQSFAEILLLQYVQGFRGNEFGFGKADKEKMLDILRLHTAMFDKVQRAKYVAEQQGANLLYHIAYALKNGRDPGSPSGPYKLVAYVGHDTNTANLAALLDLHWQLPEYPQDDIPPGGALAFELRQGADHQPTVYAFFTAQSPDAMREQTGAAPDRVPVKARRCPPGGGLCATADFVVPLAQFVAMTTPILEQNRECLTD